MEPAGAKCGGRAISHLDPLESCDRLVHTSSWWAAGATWRSPRCALPWSSASAEQGARRSGHAREAVQQGMSGQRGGWCACAEMARLPSACKARPALLDKVRDGYVACVEAQGASARGAQRRAGLLGSRVHNRAARRQRQSRDLQPCFIGRASKLQQVWSDDRGGRMTGAVRRRGLSRRWGRSRSSLKSPANPDARGDSVTSRFRHGGRSRTGSDERA